MKRLTLIILLMFAACSDQQVYESLKNNRLSGCNKLQGNAYRECMGEYTQSYDEYKAARDDSLQ